jgi:hypothetical protein
MYEDGFGKDQSYLFDFVLTFQNVRVKLNVQQIKMQIISNPNPTDYFDC